MSVWLWLLHVGGIDDTTSNWYGFWSGIGSDLGEFAVLAVLWHKINCHAKGCWRIGLHHVEGTPYITCRHHSPHVPNEGATAEQIATAHAAAKHGQWATPPEPR